MTIKVAVHRVCDRCQHPFDTSSLKYGEDLPKFETKQIACTYHGPEGKGEDKILFLYNDLCTDCDRIVDGYIKRIRMEEADEVKPKKPKKGEKPVEAEAKPTKEARFEPSAEVAQEPVEAAPAPEPTSAPVVDSTTTFSPNAVSAPVVVATEVAPHPF